MEKLVDKYISQLIPGFLYSYYFIGYKGNLVLFLLQVLFYGLVLSISVRSAYYIFTLFAVKVGLWDARHDLELSELIISDPLTKEKSKEGFRKSQKNITDYIEVGNRKLSILRKKFESPNELLIPQGDNFFIILGLILIVLIDRFLRGEARDQKALIYELLILCLLWALVRNIKVLKLSLQIRRNSYQMRKLDKEIRSSKPKRAQKNTSKQKVSDG